MIALLEVSHLAATYGASQVLFDIDFQLLEGEVATLLGRNGMGKTSTVRAICGLLPIRAGDVRYAGQSIAGLEPDRIARQGIALVPEGRQLFPNLTVDEHLVAFAANRHGKRDPWTPAKVYDFFPQLAARRHHLGHRLSGGEQQMLAIGRALTTNPRLLILDEATEGLAPLIRAEIWRCLAALRAVGETLLIIDKNVDRLTALADRHSIVEKGRIVWQGRSAELAAERGLWQRYLGV